jgi:hypothetical protein
LIINTLNANCEILLITAIGKYVNAIVNLRIFFWMIKEQLKEVSKNFLLTIKSCNWKGGIEM